MDENYPGVPYVFTHSLPGSMFKDAPEDDDLSPADRAEIANELRQQYLSR